MLDDLTRRRLRRSLILQCVGAILMAGAAIVRAVAIGWDPVTVVLAGAAVVIILAAAFTGSQLRAR